MPGLAFGSEAMEDRDTRWLWARVYAAVFAHELPSSTYAPCAYTRDLAHEVAGREAAKAVASMLATFAPKPAEGLAGLSWPTWTCDVEGHNYGLVAGISDDGLVFSGPCSVAVVQCRCHWQARLPFRFDADFPPLEVHAWAHQEWMRHVEALRAGG